MGSVRCIVRDIAYAPAHGVRGRLDLALPEPASGCPIVMVIHGGGLRSLSKERMDNVATFVAEQGWVAVNVNYRLLPDAPYPAPIEDTLAAFEWIRSSADPNLRCHDRSRVALLGASAGGFLVLMMGFLLGKERVRAVVDISGPSTRARCGEAGASGFGTDPRLFAAPVDLATPAAPPLLCVHSRVDGVVSHEESVAVVDRVRREGGRAELYSYEGPDRLHGIWQRQDDPHPRLLPHLEQKIAAFLREHL
jgi:acetyl esterase/lipase